MEGWASASLSHLHVADLAISSSLFVSVFLSIVTEYHSVPLLHGAIGCHEGAREACLGWGSFTCKSQFFSKMQKSMSYVLSIDS